MVEQDNIVPQDSDTVGSDAPPQDLRCDTRILVIEDNPADGQLVRELLAEGPANCTCDVTVAATLCAGLDILRQLEVDVVLLDLSLPDSFGFRTVASLRQADSQTPVVVMTGYGDDNVESRALHEGAQGFISKNEMDQRTLRRVIRRAIIRKSQEDELRITYRFLTITNRHTGLAPLARDFVREIRAFTKCVAARIRIWDRLGVLHDLGATGFPEQEGACDTCQYFKSDSCHCVLVASGLADSNNAFYTPAGSFYMESRHDAEHSGGLDPEQTRHVCLNQPYESVALIPIRSRKKLKGIIHVADFREYMLSVEMVELLEKIAMHLGAAIDRIRTAEALSERETEIFTMFEGAPLPMIALDSSLTVRSINGCGLEFCGRAYPEEAVNQPLATVLGCWNWRAGDCLEGTDAQCLKCPLHTLLTDTFAAPGVHGTRQVFMLLRRFGEHEPRHLFVTACRLQVAGSLLALLYLQDVTHLRLLQTREHAVRAMADQSGQNMFVVECPGGRFVAASRAFCDNLAMAHADVLDRVYADVASAPEWQQFSDESEGCQGAPIRLSLRRADGAPFAFNALVHPFVHADQRFLACTEVAADPAAAGSSQCADDGGYQNA